MAVPHTSNISDARSFCSAIESDVLDLEVFKAFDHVKSDDGSDILIELIDLYLEGTAQHIGAINEAAEKEDWILLKRIAHTLKGSSSTLGLRQIAEACQGIEEVSLDPIHDINALIRLLELYFRQAEPALIAERNRRLGLSH